MIRNTVKEIFTSNHFTEKVYPDPTIYPPHDLVYHLQQIISDLKFQERITFTSSDLPSTATK